MQERGEQLTGVGAGAGAGAGIPWAAGALFKLAKGVEGACSVGFGSLGEVLASLALFSALIIARFLDDS